MQMNSQSEKLPLLAVVVPCYNEEPVIKNTAGRLLEVLDDLKSKSFIHPSSFLYFVDDGSKDGTWEIIASLHRAENSIKGLKLSRNAGHQNAVLAGLLNVKNRVDCVVTLDADLQDDISVIKTMVEDFLAGKEIIYGVRKERKSDTILKKITALFFYRFMRFMGADIVFNHADFRLCSKRVLDELADFREVNLFLRGIFPLLGFESSIVYYDRSERLAGKSKYPFRKMLSFAFEGITSFSVAPMRFVSVVGFLVFVASLLLSVWALVSALTGKVIPGWASTVIPIYFIGGVQLLSIGLIGEYIGKIYKEVKARPRFIKEKELF
ncbi:MAG: glycosyltransferase family 2 protein [Nitrospirota bacterium]|nr:glycosyltransferase family 2 protein [Nitrospirota bacterium]